MANIRRRVHFSCLTVPARASTGKFKGGFRTLSAVGLAAGAPHAVTAPKQESQP